MAIPVVGILVGALGSIGSKLVGTLIGKLLTEKVVIRVALILLEKLVKSSKNKLDDKVFAEVKKALEE